MGKTIEYLNAMLNEHGSSDWRGVMDGYLPLVERCRKQFLSAYDKQKESGDLWYYDESFDEYFRRRYAFVVGSKTLHLKGYALRAFIHLRTQKVWGWTTTDAAESLKDLSSVLTLGPCWGLSTQSLVDLGKAGFQPEMGVRLLQILINSYSRLNKATCQRHNYLNGIHTGEAVESFTSRVRRGHVKMARIFLRVSAITAPISTSPVPSRYLGILERLGHEELNMTLTDSRNWSPSHWGDLKFRLIVIPKESSEWQPVRNNLRKVREWKISLGRVPKREDVRYLPEELIYSFTKKTFTEFMNTVRDFELQDHQVLAAARLIAAFGKGTWRKYVETVYSTVSASSIHDSGINLPNTLTSEQVKFLLRYTHKQVESQRVVKNWDYVLSVGINPLGKEGLSTALKAMAVLTFDNVKHPGFAIEAAKWTTDQDTFERYQDQWLKGLNGVAYESIPKVTLSDGDYKFYRLDRDDPRGVFLGEYTGCCQHPAGAGHECAWHGVSDPNGAFVILEYRGEIKYQSWVWRTGDSLVFDNVEGHGRADTEDLVSEIYITGIRSFLGKLGIQKVYVGAGNSDMNLSNRVIPNPVAPKGYGGYRDSLQVFDLSDWRIGNEE